MVTRHKPNPLVAAGVLAVPAVAAWVAIIYVCHNLVAGAAVVLELIARSL